VFDWRVDVAAIQKCTRVEESQAAWWVHYSGGRKPGFIMPQFAALKKELIKQERTGGWHCRV